jgi:peptidoglycan hydrolase-like protein with peptidoglycan-binding domain
MRLNLVPAAVIIAALSMPAAAMAGSEGGAGPGGAAGANHGAPRPIFTSSLAFGAGYDRPAGSPQVRVLQRRLAAEGFRPGPIDGLYGPRTTVAISRFQAARGLTVDGVAGPTTLRALSSPVTTLYPGAGYGYGGSRLVGDLQRLLTRAGYDPGPVDGRYGPRTERAVKRFQTGHRLRADGIAHPRTFTALREEAQPRNRARSAARPLTPSLTTGSRPRSASPALVHAPVPALVTRTRDHSGGWSILWPALLATALAGTLLVIAVAYSRRLRAAQPSPSANGSANGHVPGSSPPQKPGVVNGHVSTKPTRATEDGADADDAFRLGVLFEEQDDLAAAMAAYRKADQVGHAAAASNLGVLLERSGDLAGAEAAYRRADERGDRNGAFNLAMLLEEHNDLTGAEAAYRRADDQAHAAAASNLGVLLERRGDRDGAQAAYQRADERGDANGAFNRAVLLEELGDLAAAEAAYRRADQRGPAEVANASRAALRALAAGPNGAHIKRGEKRPGGGRARNGGARNVR